jgi:hypothetical protein
LNPVSAGDVRDFLEGKGFGGKEQEREPWHGNFLAMR